MAVEVVEMQRLLPLAGGHQLQITVYRLLDGRRGVRVAARITPLDPWSPVSDEFLRDAQGQAL